MKYPVEVLTQAEIHELLRGCPASPVGARNKALIAVMYRAGLRCAEALALKPSDIDPEKGTIRVLHGKGDKSRVTGVDDGTLEYIQAWLDTRQELGVVSDRLFCTLKSRPMNGRYVRELFSRLGRNARISKRVHPHGLRHTHASELVHELVPLNVISKDLGHSTCAVTARYVETISNPQVVEMIRNRPPWAA